MTRSFQAGLLLLACLCSSAEAQDAAAGRDKAMACTPCHGPDGIAVAPNAPHIAGENAAYLTSQLKAFRSGERQHEQMSIIAADLTDEDIADLARWFSMIEITAKIPDLD